MPFLNFYPECKASSKFKCVSNDSLWYIWLKGMIRLQQILLVFLSPSSTYLATSVPLRTVMLFSLCLSKQMLTMTLKTSTFGKQNKSPTANLIVKEFFVTLMQSSYTYTSSNFSSFNKSFKVSKSAFRQLVTSSDFSWYSSLKHKLHSVNQIKNYLWCIW